MKLIILIDNFFAAIADITVQVKDELILTAFLMLEATLLSMLLGVLFGTLAARKPNGFFDRFTGVLGGILSGFPAFILAFPAALVMEIIRSSTVLTGNVKEIVYLLPAACAIAIPEAVLLATLMKNMALREWSGTYVNEIRSTGCKDGKIYSKHIKKAAFQPVLKFVGKVVADVFAGCIMTEFLLALNGAAAHFTTCTYVGLFKNAGVIMMWGLLVAIAVKLIFDIVYYTIEAENGKEIHNKQLRISYGRYTFKSIFGCILSGLILGVAAAGLILTGNSTVANVLREYSNIIIRLWLPAMAAVGMACLAGALIAVLSWLIGGPVDQFITKLNAMIAGLPCLLIALIAYTLLGRSFYAPTVATAIALFPGFAYAIRGEFTSKWNMKASRKTKFKYSCRIRVAFDRVLPNAPENIPAAVIAGLSSATVIMCFVDFICTPKTIFDDCDALFALSEQLGLVKAGVLGDVGLIQLAMVPVMLISLRLVYDCFSTMPERRVVKGKKLISLTAEAEEELKKVNEAENRRDKLVQRTTVNEYSEAPAEPAPEKFPEKQDTPAVFAVEDLTLGIREKEGWRFPVKNLTFTLHQGESAFICCDTEAADVLTEQIMGFEKGTFCRIGGRAQLEGIELTTLDKKSYTELRGKKLALANIGSVEKLDPLQRVGLFAEETLENHGLPGSGAGGSEAIYREVVYSAFAEAGIAEPDDIFDMYPDELSADEADFVQLASAAICEPELLLVRMKGHESKLSKECLGSIKRFETAFNAAVLIITESDDLRRNAVCREIKLS